MIIIYSPDEVQIEQVKRRDLFVSWDYPIEEIDYLLESAGDGSTFRFVLLDDRLVEISESELK